MSSCRRIVFIMTDTQRSDMLGCYGTPGIATPSLDGLASEGIRFKRAYTTQPVCGPARSAIFTGMYPHSNGSYANSIALSANVRTLGQRLSDMGLHTAYIGKWHLDGGDYFGCGKCPEGYDARYWYDMKNYLDELTDEDKQRSRRAATSDEGIDEGFTFGHRCADRAIDFLERHGGEDFFLTLSFDEPHDPYLCPEPYASMYDGYDFPRSENIRDSLAQKPDYQRAWAGETLHEDKEALDITNRRLLACNSFADYEIGRVIRAIDRYAEDALVIYTSDHGDFMCSHSLSGKGPAVYDEITRIPLIIRQRGRIPAGLCYEHPVSHIDLAPTIFELLGIECPRAFEGRSLVPMLSDIKTRINEHIFIEFGRYEIDHDGFGGFQPLRAVYDGRYKLSINLLSQDELYDLENDSAELTNLIDSAAHREIRDRLHDAVLRFMNDTRDPFRGYHWERRPWRTDAREASWAYTGMTRQRENEPWETRQLVYETGLTMTDAVRRK